MPALSLWTQSMASHSAHLDSLTHRTVNDSGCAVWKQLAFLRVCCPDGSSTSGHWVPLLSSGSITDPTKLGLPSHVDFTQPASLSPERGLATLPPSSWLDQAGPCSLLSSGAPLFRGPQQLLSCGHSCDSPAVLHAGWRVIDSPATSWMGQVLTPRLCHPTQ